MPPTLRSRVPSQYVRHALTERGVGVPPLLEGVARFTICWVLRTASFATTLPVLFSWRDNLTLLLTHPVRPRVPTIPGQRRTFRVGRYPLAPWAAIATVDPVRNSRHVYRIHHYDATAATLASEPRLQARFRYIAVINRADIKNNSRLL